MYNRVTIEETWVHHVRTNSDLTEGRGAVVTLGVFADEAYAKEYAKGRGIMGTPADIKSEMHAVYSHGGKRYLQGAPLLEETDITCKLRAAALAKLTPTERELLGLE